MKPLRRLFPFLLLLVALGRAGAASDRPNVLFIAVDDLKPLMGAYGVESIATLHLDALAARGTTFLNAACQFPVCGPSRASLLTGLRPEATGVLNLKTKMRDVHPDILTLPQVFKQQGYTTAGIGKIFDPRCVDGRQTGDAVSWSIPYAENPAPLDGIEPIKEGKEATAVYDLPDEAFADGRIARHAIELLQQFAAKPEPFFLAVGFKKPHLPFVMPQRHWDAVDLAALTLAPFQQEASGNSGYGYWNSNEVRGYEGVPDEGEIDAAVQRRLLHGYFACTGWIDELLGRVVGQLDELGLRDNTVIVLWGDHGWHLGDHGLWGKHTVFEDAIRAPLLIVDPRINRTVRTEAPVEFTDIFPTLCELTGVKAPVALQGVSLVPALRDPAARPRAASIAYYRSGGAVGYTLRTERYRYVEWIDQKSAHIVGRDLFDFEIDPLGTRNWADDPEHAAELAELAQLLHADATGWTLLQRHLAQSK